MQPEPSLCHLREVRRSFGRLRVLDGVDLTVHSGERILLLGANGSGKSTLLRIAAGLIRPDGGQVVTTTLPAYLGHHLALYGDLTVRENLELFARLAGAGEAAAEWLAAWHLTEHRDRRLRDLSRGLQLRTALARTIGSARTLLLLDEPTSALDDEGVSELCHQSDRRLVPNSGAAVVVTHDVSRLRAWATRIVVLARGRMVIDSGVAAAAAPLDAVIEAYRRENR